ncbi:helix-turn-helix domain-containing protein [Lentzea sp. NPDC051838]|uniref:helix-turn-helix domain-containing protein n=1 Tax=Lentzea sp. NPDC051838 TaxID=3154849 RepID=UPI0034466D7F
MLTLLIDRSVYSRNRRPIHDAVGVSAAALSQYTRDQTRPSLQKLVALADFFGVSLDYLVHGEPTGPMLDPSPLARYVDHALSDIQAKASRQSALVARLGRLLAEHIETAAQQLGTAVGEGLILDDEALRLERYCVAADIMPLNLGFNVISMDGGTAAPGQFLHTVAENLQKGCKYRFLLTGNLAEQDDVVRRFRSLLSARAGSDRVYQNCTFRRTEQPVMAYAVFYRLDVESLVHHEPLLYEQFSGYVDDDGQLGYVVRPNNESNVDILMGKDRVTPARQAFGALWAGAAQL